MTATAQLRHMNAIYQAQRERISAEWDKLSVITVQTRLHQLGETRREDAISELAKRAMREVLATEAQPTTNAELRRSQDTLFDDVATLPIFSGTPIPAAGPGRFDPPAVSAERQARLF